MVAGARRYRAAKLAELSEVTVRAAVLSDAAVCESQLTENLFREDVHPYEEALALAGLFHLEGCGYDVASIASRLGKSPAYITTRIRLTELLPVIAEAFLQARSESDRSQAATGTDHHGTWNEARRQRLGTGPLCRTRARQSHKVEAAALALSEAMQTHGRSDCGRWRRARPHNEGVRGADMRGSLCRPF